MINFTEEPGWVGVFTRNQAEGAIPNGTRIEKSEGEAGDSNPIGATGTVLGSLPAPDGMPAKFAHVKHFYFVEWDNYPKQACGVLDYKIKPI